MSSNEGSGGVSVGVDFFLAKIVELSIGKRACIDGLGVNPNDNKGFGQWRAAAGGTPRPYAQLMKQRRAQAIGRPFRSHSSQAGLSRRIPEGEGRELP